jgi:N-acetylglutamate synthase-like GNAT family acetyltransferase
MIIKQVDESFLKYYATHLKNLSEQDKFTRFSYKISDANVDQLILNILYSSEMHVLFAAIEESGETAGFCHLARCKGDDWELAVSVNSDRQNSGIGNRLMSYAISYAKMHGIESVFMHCINDNKRIQHLAKKHGLRVVERDGCDITSHLKIPQPTFIEYAADFLKEQAEISSQMLELQKRWLSNFSGK